MSCTPAVASSTSVNEYKSLEIHSPLNESDPLEFMDNVDIGPHEDLTGTDRDVSARVGSFYPWPLPDAAVHKALEQAFADGSWGRYSGPHSARLRVEIAALHDVENVVLCSSGTVAIERALRGVKVSTGDEVMLAGYDF